MKKAEKRARLLLELERIVGNECYNGHIQNWGPRGRFDGEGRSFRYPIMFNVDGKWVKHWRVPIDEFARSDVAKTGYYRLGANELYIMRALDRVVAYLEEHNDLKI